MSCLGSQNIMPIIKQIATMMLATAALLLLLLSEPSVVAASRDTSFLKCCFVAGSNNNQWHHRNARQSSSSPTSSLCGVVPKNTIPIISSSSLRVVSNNNKRRDRHHSHRMSLSSSSHVNMPPYGTIRKFTILSSSRNNNMMMDDGYYPPPNNNYRDDRWQKKMKSRNRVADPIIQDFGTKDDWEASKHGLGRKKGGNNTNNGMMMGMNMADDMIHQVENTNTRNDEEMMRMEMERGRVMEEEERAMILQQQEQQQMLREREERMMFDGDGGNFWMNPMNKLDRYPMGSGSSSRRRRSSGGRRNNRRRNNNDVDDEEEEWWETKRNAAARAPWRYDDDDDDEYLEDYDDEYYYNDDEERGDYGIPPPSRSRSSFRSGGLSPPRPIKGFYDKLFWFGFDPDVTQPTDRTMFGGTRGKFNALDLLRDRDERQQRRMMREMRRRRDNNYPVIQDFGNVGSDWDAKKFGKGRTGGDLTSDDQRFVDDEIRGGMPPPPPPPPRPFPGDMPPGMESMPPPGMPQYDIEPDFFDEEMTRNSRSNSRRGRKNRRRRGRRNNDVIDARAAAYDRAIGLGPLDDDDYIMMDEDGPVRPGRRRGYAYKLDDEDFDDDDLYIDIEPTYASERENMPPRRGRRSWEERALEMDRVPPRGVAAWGPNGPVSDDVQTMAAMDAMEEIKRAKKFLEKKEDMVEDAKEEVVALKADATFYERQLDGVGGSAARTLEKELGLILRDVEDSQRMLRMARAERDAASRQVENLEARHWALLSEYEATQSFDD